MLLPATLTVRVNSMCLNYYRNKQPLAAISNTKLYTCNEWTVSAVSDILQ